MASETTDRKLVRTTNTTFDILEELQSVDAASLSELTDRMGLAKSTVHRHLVTLQNRGYVVKENGNYHLGMRFLRLGEHARNRKKFSLVESKVEELAEITQERAQLVVEQSGYAVFVYIAHGEHAVRTDPGVGHRVPITVGASGKSILAHSPKERIEWILDEHGLPAVTEHSITSMEELIEELELIREQGFGTNDQESMDGLRAVGVPIRGSDGYAIGGLSVSGPIRRMRGERYEEELPNLLLGVANELELNIAHS